MGDKRDTWREDARLNMEDLDNECVIELGSFTQRFIAYDSIICTHT